MNELIVEALLGWHISDIGLKSVVVVAMNYVKLIASAT
jgi:hypothetical protein